MINEVEASAGRQSGVAHTAPARFTPMDRIRGGIALVALVSILFVSAGRWDVVMFWAYWVVLCVCGFSTLRLVHRKHRDLLVERARPGPGARDAWARPVLVLLMGAHWILAGMDVGRYHWSDPLPLLVQVAALAVMAAGLAGWGWAMVSNRFFSSEVRIQTERGHRVESEGPYRFVRHPGYLSALFVFSASPLALGSMWSAIPIAAVLLIFLRRTALEDGMLRAELESYADYAAQVRYRLVPGVW